jgi:hypothetical protein
MTWGGGFWGVLHRLAMTIPALGVEEGAKP